MNKGRRLQPRILCARKKCKGGVTKKGRKRERKRKNAKTT